MRLVFVIALILVIVFFSCEKKTDDSFEIYREWTLGSIENTSTGEITNYPDTLTKKIFIGLTDSSYVCLSGYCNYGGGNYNIEGNKISFYDLYMTEMACSLLLWEEYLYQLYDAETFELRNDVLKIFTKGNYNLIFKEKHKNILCR